MFHGALGSLSRELEYGCANRWFSSYMLGDSAERTPVMNMTVGEETRRQVKLQPYPGGSCVFEHWLHNLDIIVQEYGKARLRPQNSGGGASFESPPVIRLRDSPAGVNPSPGVTPEHLDDIRPTSNSWQYHQAAVAQFVAAWPPISGAQEVLFGQRQLGSWGTHNLTKIYDVAGVSNSRAAVVSAPPVVGASTGMSMRLRGRQDRFVHSSVMEGVPARLQWIIE